MNDNFGNFLIKSNLVGKINIYCYKKLRRKYQFNDWHLTPVQNRQYAQDIVGVINKFYQKSTLEQKNKLVVEIGCGLGDIIRHVNAGNKLGVDIDRNVIEAAKHIDWLKKITWKVGTFKSVYNKQIRFLITVNFVHDIPTETLKVWYYNLIKNNEIDYIIVDEIRAADGETPYKFFHDFSKILPDEYKIMKTIGRYRIKPKSGSNYCYRLVLLYKRVK